MRVQDDTWTEHGWMNNQGYVSHWQPINAPGTYSEIMQRERGETAHLDPKSAIPEGDDWFSPAVNSHIKMMQMIYLTQIQLRLETPNQKPGTRNEN